jgi:hypothetical protein
MSYDPDDQRITFKQVLAGWSFCIALVGVALATTGHHRAMSTANRSDPTSSVAALCSLSSVQRPTFVAYAEERGDAVTTARKLGSLPMNSCG